MRGIPGFFGLSLWIAVAAGSCGGEVVVESAPGSGASKLEVGPLQPLLELAEGAPWLTRFHGTRRIESRFFEGGHEVTLAYREEVWADGEGGFALDMIELLSFVPDPVSFEAMQELREGYLYRYRDFALRDLSLFYQSFVAVDLDQETEVAGRRCKEVRVVPGAGPGTTYDLALDVETGLVLRGVELDPLGVEVHRMEFETYDAAPDLEGVVWYQPSNPETALDPRGDLSAQAGYPVMQPIVLPDGYELWKAATLLGEQGEPLVKLTYTNGVMPLFLFHGLDAKPAILAPGGLAAVAGISSGDVLWSYSMGPVQIVEGQLRGTQVVALGKVDSETLLDMLESAID